MKIPICFLLPFRKKQNYSRFSCESLKSQMPDIHLWWTEWHPIESFRTRFVLAISSCFSYFNSVLQEVPNLNRFIIELGLLWLTASWEIMSFVCLHEFRFFIRFRLLSWIQWVSRTNSGIWRFNLLKYRIVGSLKMQSTIQNLFRYSDVFPERLSFMFCNETYL